jgi:hypothetical protein
MEEVYTMRYQVLDPNFDSGNLGGNLITVIDGISVVNMTPQQASYWLTMGSVIPLGPVSLNCQLNYQLAALGCDVGAIVIDSLSLSVFPGTFYVTAPEMDIGAIEIDAGWLVASTGALGVFDFVIGSPVIDKPSLGVHVAAMSSGIVVGSPSIAIPSLKIVWTLSAVGVAVGSPVIAVPPLVLYTGAVAISIAVGSPAIAAPPLKVANTLLAAGFAVGSPAIGAPSKGTNTPLANGLAVGSPAIGVPPAIIVKSFIATSIIVGSPALPALPLVVGSGLPILLLADGSSKLLLSDGVSRLALEN